jgi:F0F1-type ATP synthase membrane subunit a
MWKSFAWSRLSTRRGDLVPYNYFKYNLNCHYLGLTFDWTNTEIYWTVSQSNIVYSATLPSDTSASISSIASSITSLMFLTLCVRLHLYFLYKKTNYTHLSRGLIEMYVGFFNDVIDDVIDEREIGSGGRFIW